MLGCVAQLAQLWIRSNYTFEGHNDLETGCVADLDRSSERMGIDDVELFETFQIQRRNLLTWLARNTHEWTQLFDGIVEWMTMDPNGRKRTNVRRACNPRGAQDTVSLWHETHELACPGAISARLPNPANQECACKLGTPP